MNLSNTSLIEEVHKYNAQFLLGIPDCNICVEVLYNDAKMHWIVFFFICTPNFIEKISWMWESSLFSLVAFQLRMVKIVNIAATKYDESMMGNVFYENCEFWFAQDKGTWL